MQVQRLSSSTSVLAVLTLVIRWSGTKAQQEMRPFIDQYRETLLSPLKHLPPLTCESRQERKAHLHCCIHSCFRQPLNLAMDRVLSDYYITCQPTPLVCNSLTRDFQIGSLEAELDPVKPVIPKQRMKEMLARIDPREQAIRFAKWYARLFLGWILHKSFNRGLTLIKTLVQAANGAAAP